MIDTNALRDAVRVFECSSNPSNGCHGDPATIADVRKVVENVTTVLNAFIQEIEESQG